MNYHNILHDDMRNGDGLRVVLFVSGCGHHCQGCQNPQTWPRDSGIEFDLEAKEEIYQQLSEDYISGITFSGGDPLNDSNVYDVLNLCKEINEKYPDKTLWVYTGFTWEEINHVENEFSVARKEVLEYIDVLVEGRFVEALADVNYHWAGSTNQRVIDVCRSIENKQIILYEE